MHEFISNLDGNAYLASENKLIQKLRQADNWKFVGYCDIIYTEGHWSQTGNISMSQNGNTYLDIDIKS